MPCQVRRKYPQPMRSPPPRPCLAPPVREEYRDIQEILGVFHLFKRAESRGELCYRRLDWPAGSDRYSRPYKALKTPSHSITCVNDISPYLDRTAPVPPTTIPDDLLIMPGTVVMLFVIVSTSTCRCTLRERPWKVAYQRDPCGISQQMIVFEYG